MPFLPPNQQRQRTEGIPQLKQQKWKSWYTFAAHCHSANVLQSNIILFIFTVLMPSVICRRSTGGRSNRSTTSRPQNAGQRHVFPSATHSSSFRAVCCILVTTSGELILLPVWDRHPKLNVRQCLLTIFSDSNIVFGHFRASRTFWVQNGGWNYFWFRFWPEILTQRTRFPIRKWICSRLSASLKWLLLQRSHYKATRRREISKSDSHCETKQCPTTRHRESTYLITKCWNSA